jgi:chromosomal replication initiator protein
MQLIFNFPITPHYTFANFVVCSGNQTAWNFSQRILDSTANENILYLHGAHGSGKTHLLTAIGTQLANSLSIAIPIVTVDKLSLQAIESIRLYPALLLDDLHLLPQDADLSLAIWQLFNDFYASGRKIIVTATCPPKEITPLDGHLSSRLLWGLVGKLDISDDDSRRMILKKLADDRQITIPDEVISFLLVHVHRGIPSLAAALDTLSSHALVTKRRVSLRLAKEALTPADTLLLPHEESAD